MIQKNLNTLPRKKRIILVALVIAIQAIYTPTSLFLSGGIEPKLPIDVFPLWTAWVIPYALCYPLWATGIVWLILKMDDQRFCTTITGLFFTCSLGVSIFILFPTYVTLPILTGTDIFTKLLHSIQVAGGTHDAFPSSHIYITTILAYFYRDWYPRYKWLWLLIIVTISLSTLFTQQHYVIDVLGGYLAGWLGYRFGLWWNTMGGRLRRRKPSHA